MENNRQLGKHKLQANSVDSSVFLCSVLAESSQLRLCGSSAVIECHLEQ